MPPDLALAPWRPFLAAIDAECKTAVDLYCIGGFAATVLYELQRPTGDIDVFEVVPGSEKQHLVSVAGQASGLHKQHGIYLQIASVATLPHNYADRLNAIVVGEFSFLRVFVPDRYDLALSKLERNWPRDLEDVKHLARSDDFDLTVLEDRYRSELRPFLSGPKSRHDVTMKLWREMIEEQRKSG